MFIPEADHVARLDALAASYAPIFASGRRMSDPVVGPDGSLRTPIVVWVDGCFDMMHYGHSNALRQARAMGDFLVAGVHSDEEIRCNKGPPVMCESERYAAVASCKWVDVVVPRAPYSINVALLDAFRCDFCVHGDDFSGTAEGTDCYEEVKLASRYRECRRTRGVSTTELVGRMLLMTRDHLVVVPLSQQPPKCLSPAKGIVSLPNGLEAGGEGALSSSSSSSQFSVPAVALRTATTLRRESKSRIDAALLSCPNGASVGVSFDGTKAQGASNESLVTPISSGSNGHYTAAQHSLTTSSRIVQFSEGREPQENDRVVYYAGDFDLFHIGHIEALKAAKARGDFLLVGVYDDATVNQLLGSNFPLMTLNERVLSVLSCRYVDEVVIGAPLVATEELLSGSSTAVGKISEVVTFRNAPEPSMCPETRAAAIAESLVPAREIGILAELDWPTNELAMFTGSDILRRIIEHRKMYEERNRKKSSQAVVVSSK